MVALAIQHDVTFQQDNVRAHVARYGMTLVVQNNFKILERRQHNPDLVQFGIYGAFLTDVNGSVKTHRIR